MGRVALSCWRHEERAKQLLAFARHVANFRRGFGESASKVNSSARSARLYVSEYIITVSFYITSHVKVGDKRRAIPLCRKSQKADRDANVENVNIM